MQEVNNKKTTLNKLFKLSSNYNNAKINKAISQRTTRDSKTTTLKQLFGRILRNKIHGRKRAYSDTEYNNGNAREILLAKNKFERNIKVLNSNSNSNFRGYPMLDQKLQPKQYKPKSLNINISISNEKTFIGGLLVKFNKININTKKDFAKFIRHYIKLLKLKKDFCSIKSFNNYSHDSYDIYALPTIIIDGNTVTFEKKIFDILYRANK